MGFQLKPAVREGVYVIIGLAGASGSGKTWTALLLASGLVGDGKIGVIDTEARRALHYADQFKFEHLDFTPPFNPLRYIEALKVLEDAGCKVAIIDSGSHAHAGDGGLLDMHEAELNRMAGNDWKKREACSMAAWVKPKGEQKRFVQKMLQCRMHIIFCLRAEEKVKMEKRDNKTVIVNIGWQPICEKNLPYEMTCSFVLDPTNPGVPIPVKLQEQHKHIFPLNKQIDRECGVKLAEWAAGTKTQSKAKAENSVANNPVSLNLMIEDNDTQGLYESLKDSISRVNNPESLSLMVSEIKKHKEKGNLTEDQLDDLRNTWEAKKKLFERKAD